MRKILHLCWSGGDEVLFRSEEDYRHGIICLCLAAVKSDTRLLAYCFMSNHVHMCVNSERTEYFIKCFRYAYSRYFNSRYFRKGRLGERNFFILEIEGLYHFLTAIAYVLRNPLHHGICSTPFEYEFSSVRAAFRKELGYVNEVSYMPEKKLYRYLPDRNLLPETVKMNIHGLIMPESVIDVYDLEHQFSTARSYLYFMNRISGKNWEAEQAEDMNGRPPIRIEDVEQGVRGLDMKTLLSNEYGRSNYKSMTDIEVCHEIDINIVKSFGTVSVYRMTRSQLKEVARILACRYHLPRAQIVRCLGGLPL